jgi:hypothetical protein
MIETRYYFKRSELIFFLAWIFFLFSLLFESTALYQTYQESFSTLTKGLRYCAYLICCFKIIFYNRNVKQKSLAVLLFIILCFILSCIASTNKTMILYLLILLGAIGVESKRLIKLTIWIQGVFLSVVVILSKIGILQDYVFGKGTNRIRHGLGFSWTTTGPILYFYFLLGFIYMKKEKFTLKEAVLLEIINVFFYQETDSKMAFLLSSLFLFIFVFESKFKREKQSLKSLEHDKLFLMLIPILLLLIAIFSAKLYDPSKNILNSLNSLLSNRLELGHRAIEKYGFSIFGQKIEWVGFNIQRPTLDNEYNYVDSSYLQLTLEYGFLFIFIVIGIYVYGIYRAIESEDRYLLYIYIIILLFALTEPRLMNFAFNPFPLLIFTYASEDKTYLNEKDIEESYG